MLDEVSGVLDEEGMEDGLDHVSGNEDKATEQYKKSTQLQQADIKTLEQNCH